MLCCLEQSTPKCSGELRRWSDGSYTLLHDGEAARAEYALDRSDFAFWMCV